MASPTASGPPPAGTWAAPPARSGPSNTGYVIGGILAGIGVVVGVVLIVVGAVAFTSIKPDNFPRTHANHTLRIDFTHAGGYVAYYESDAVGSSIDSDSDVPDFSLTITDPDGNRVPTNVYSSTLTYSNDGHHGIAAKTFHIDAPGIYSFKVGSLPGGSSARVAFGRSTAGATVGGVVLVLAGIFGGGLIVLVGVVVIIITAVRRRRHRNQTAAGAGYGAPPGGYAPPPTAPAWTPAPPSTPPPSPAPPPPSGTAPPPPEAPRDPNTPPPLPPPGSPGP